MSTSVADHLHAGAPDGAAALSDPRPGLLRLARIELRKMLDTRAGFWLPVATLIATVAVAAVTVLRHHGEAVTLAQVFTNAAQPAGYLLPVMGVLLICGEFTQRTALVTFTLAPRRIRVVAAKLIASVFLATVAFAFAAVSTFALTYAFAHGAGGVGHLGAGALAQGWLYLALETLMGFAFGCLVLVSAAAIAGFLLLPMVSNMVVTSSTSLATPAHWLNPYNSLLALIGQSTSPVDFSHVAATAAVWILVPLALGLVRVIRLDL